MFICPSSSFAYLAHSQLISLIQFHHNPLSCVCVCLHSWDPQRETCQLKSWHIYGLYTSAWDPGAIWGEIGEILHTKGRGRERVESRPIFFLFLLLRQIGPICIIFHPLSFTSTLWLEPSKSVVKLSSSTIIRRSISFGLLCSCLQNA